MTVVLAKEGDELGASVVKKLDGCHIVELDSTEEAILPNSHLGGRDKVARYCELNLGSELRVRVLSVEQGKGFTRRIVVREIGNGGQRKRRRS